MRLDILQCFFTAILYYQNLKYTRYAEKKPLKLGFFYLRRNNPQNNSNIFEYNFHTLNLQNKTFNALYVITPQKHFLKGYFAKII
jgi:hypothetical protein